MLKGKDKERKFRSKFNFNYLSSILKFNLLVNI